MTTTHRAFAGRVSSLCLLAMTLGFMLNAGGESCAADLSGCWSGSWQSCTCRHHGPMSATFCKLDDTSYRVDFRGRFWKVFPFRYSVVLNVVEDGDVVKLQGSSYLGRIMGTFTYDATATGTEFNATYTSCKDWGYFVMTRCCSASGCCH